MTPRTTGVPTTDLTAAVECFWTAAEAGGWTAFAGTPAEDVVSRCRRPGGGPPARAKPRAWGSISGRLGYVRFNREYPGDWHGRTERVVAEPDQVVTWMHVTVGPEEMHAVAFFTGDGHGRTATVTDFCPSRTSLRRAANTWRSGTEHGPTGRHKGTGRPDPAARERTAAPYR